MTKQLPACHDNGAFSETTEGALFLPGARDDSVTDRPLEHLPDEALQLLIESTSQLKEDGCVVIDEDGQVIPE